MRELKFDFRMDTKSSKVNKYSDGKFRKVRDSIGDFFITSTSTPSSVEVVRTYLSSNGWLDSVEEFDRTARINIVRQCDSVNLSVEDARQLLPLLQDLVADAEQVRDALIEVLPMKDDDDVDVD